jgi:molybdopterin converting factor small subunit
MNLIEGLQKEIHRNRNLVKIYNEVPNGAFASIMINQDIVDAERAMAEGDTIAMIRLFETLQNNSE